MNSSKNSSTDNPKKELPILPLLFAAFLFMLISALLSLCLGASGISLKELLHVLFRGNDGTAAGRIIWFVRIPRTCATLLAGAGLAVSGAMIQNILSNHLASPGIIGINAGAGMAVAIACAFGYLSGWVIAGSAFFGALLAAFLVVETARRSGASRTTVILGGVAVNACLNAVTQTITTMVPDAALASADFRVGGFSSVNTARVIPAGVLILLGIALAISLSNELDVLSLGDEAAGSLGLRVRFARNGLLTLAALLAGASVSFAGVLGFVGLIVPHISRFFAGSESSRLIPFSALFGAGFVTLCDLIARMVFAPYELPAGILLSFLGGPFFIFLLLKRKGARG